VKASAAAGLCSCFRPCCCTGLCFWGRAGPQSCSPAAAKAASTRRTPERSSKWRNDSTTTAQRQMDRWIAVALPAPKSATPHTPFKLPSCKLPPLRVTFNLLSASGCGKPDTLHTLTFRTLVTAGTGNQWVRLVSPQPIRPSSEGSNRFTPTRR
jgi:hypothetical protein